MPVHCLATTMEIPGKLKSNPSREQGMPESVKNKKAASAEAYWSAVSIQFKKNSGNGAMKNNKAKGKIKARTVSTPKQRMAQPMTKQTKEKIVRNK